MCKDIFVEVDVEFKFFFSEKIFMKSVGLLLEIWDILNVYCEIFKFDFFIFDDYVEVMFVVLEEVLVEFFIEIYCFVFKILVSFEVEGGKV